MGNKADHIISIVGGAVGLAVGGLMGGESPDHLLCLVGGSLTGIIINPDLDLAENFKLSPTKIIWYPYGKLISHRSLVSHLPVISTILRVLYLGIPFIGWALLTSNLLILQEIVLTDYFKLFIIGLMVADFNHWLLDQLPKLYRTKFKKRRRLPYERTRRNRKTTRRA